MWPFSERRRSKRHPVQWQGSLLCAFSQGIQRAVPVKVLEISLSGARLSLEKLQVGPYHLMVDSESADLHLSIPLPEAVVTLAAQIRWYDRKDEDPFFVAGVEFIDVTAESRSALKKAIGKNNEEC